MHPGTAQLVVLFVDDVHLPYVPHADESLRGEHLSLWHALKRRCPGATLELAWSGDEPVRSQSGGPKGLPTLDAEQLEPYFTVECPTRDAETVAHWLGEQHHTVKTAWVAVGEASDPHLK